MKTLFLVIAVAAYAASGLDMVKPADGMVAKKRRRLDCKDAASVRDFKAAVVEDSGWEHRLADAWARCACPKEADAAGWPNPRPSLPEAWRGALPVIKPKDHAGNVKRLVEEFFLFPQRRLPISREQATRIADCWYRLKQSGGKPAK
jgi:hypothetical protein